VPRNARSLLQVVMARVTHPPSSSPSSSPRLPSSSPRSASYARPSPGPSPPLPPVRPPREGAPVVVFEAAAKFLAPLSGLFVASDARATERSPAWLAVVDEEGECCVGTAGTEHDRSSALADNHSGSACWGIS